MTRHSKLQCATLFTLILAACGVTPDGEDREIAGAPADWAPLGGSRACSLSESEAYEQYSRCLSECAAWVVSGSGGSCRETCSDAWCLACDPKATSCYLHDYEFHGGEVFSDLKASCEAAVGRDQRCQMSSINPNCDEVAIVESRAMASVYECVASTDCTQSPDTCFPSPGTSLANTVCDAVEEQCYTQVCSAEGRQYLQHVEPWLRPEALDAAAACLNEKHCRDVKNCLYAWNQVVLEGAPTVLLFE